LDSVENQVRYAVEQGAIQIELIGKKETRDRVLDLTSKFQKEFQHVSIYYSLEGRSDSNTPIVVNALKPKFNLTWELRLKIAIDIAQGMRYLHSRSPPILHRDLKTPNVMVCHDFMNPKASVIAKIADFGLSEKLYVANVIDGTDVANPLWMAPERLKGKESSLESDVWAFGIMLWELLTQRYPLPETAENTGFIFERADAIIKGFRPPLTIQEDPSNKRYIELIKACWAQDPLDRPTFEEVCYHLINLANKYHIVKGSFVPSVDASNRLYSKKLEEYKLNLIRQTSFEPFKPQCMTQIEDSVWIGGKINNILYFSGTSIPIGRKYQELKVPLDKTNLFTNPNAAISQIVYCKKNSKVLALMNDEIGIWDYNTRSFEQLLKVSKRQDNLVLTTLCCETNGRLYVGCADGTILTIEFDEKGWKENANLLQCKTLTIVSKRRTLTL
jgi:serine/threonine protein kinase